MDFREFFRGFLGLNTSKSRPEGYAINDIDKFSGRKTDDPSDSRNDELNQIQPNNMTISSVGSGLVFGEMLSTLEGLFREMEESIYNDLEDLNQNINGNHNIAPPRHFTFEDEDESLPPPLPRPSHENIRSLVLKDGDRHPKKDKIDKNLDDLLKNSELNLSEIPLPLPNPQGIDPSVGRTFQNPSPPPSRNFSFERVYSSYSFNNGKWEGKTIRENNDGKEVTSYERNENGELTETSEFIPKRNNTIDYNQLQTLPENHQRISQPTNPLNFFVKLFRP